MTIDDFIDRITYNTSMHIAMSFEERVELCDLLRAGQVMRNSTWVRYSKIKEWNEAKFTDEDSFIEAAKAWDEVIRGET